jgi:hypothetical protein
MVGSGLPLAADPGAHGDFVGMRVGALESHHGQVLLVHGVLPPQEDRPYYPLFARIASVLTQAPGLFSSRKKVGKKEKKSPQFGKMEFATTPIPKEVTDEAYHVGSGGDRGGRV